MKRDALRYYTVELFFLVILCLALFVSNVFNTKILALVLTIFTVITYTAIKKKNTKSVLSRQVMYLMIGFGVIYLISFYLMGLYFGYYKASVQFSLYGIWNFIIPSTIIIITSELIRDRLLSYKSNLSKSLIFVDMVLVDLIVYSKVYDLSNLDDALVVIGFIFFASISCNLLYNYISVRYDNKSIIIYRLMTVLYVYIIPYIPDVYIFFRSFLRMIYPYIIYLVLEYTYSKANAASAYKDRTRNIVVTTVLMIVMCFVIALVSCRFEYGILVIGSGSMTGTIDRGDAVVYRQYHNNSISEGDIIIFYNKDVKTVHRVIKIENVNGEYRYFTKGDANQRMDDGYRTKDSIMGITNFKIKYIGYPTLWLRDIFETKK